MDELALALDLDPIALPRKIYATIDQQKDLPYTLPDALEACYQRVSEGIWLARAVFEESFAQDRRCGQPRRVTPTAQGRVRLRLTGLDKLEMTIGMRRG